MPLKVMPQFIGHAENMVQDSRKASSGITESRSTESWLVRLTAENSAGERYTVNRCLSWSAHGGKVSAYKLAQQARDELLWINIFLIIIVG